MVSGESERKPSSIQAPNQKGVGNGKTPPEGHTFTNAQKYQETGGALSPGLVSGGLYVISGCY